MRTESALFFKGLMRFVVSCRTRLRRNLSGFIRNRPSYQIGHRQQSSFPSTTSR